MVELVFTPLSVGVSLLLVVTSVLYLWLFHTQLSRIHYYRKQGLRGAPFFPFLGYLPNFVKERETVGDVAVWHNYIQKYGQVCYFLMGPQFRILCTREDYIKGILVTHGSSFQKPTWIRELLLPVLGDGLILNEGDVWRRHRHLINPAFHFAKLQAFIPLMDTCATEAITRWGAAVQHADGDFAVIEMHKEMAALTLEIIGKAAFGSDLTGSADSVYISLNKMLELAVENVLSLTAFLPYYQYLPTPGNVTMAKKLSGMRKLVTGVIAQRRAARDAGKVGEKMDVLLDFLLGAAEPDITATADSAKELAKPLSDEEICDEVTTFIMAGHETTSQTLCWTLLLLSQHPVWKTKLLEEIDEWTSEHGKFDNSTLGKLHVTSGVLHESLRLYPPAPLIARQSTSTVELDGLTISPGTFVLIPTTSLHRNEEYWSAPDEFKPERWENGLQGACKSPHMYLPFGSGSRACIGTNFALMEAKIILVRFFQQFDVEIDPSYSHHPVETVTLRPGRGMPLRVRRRNTSISTSIAS